MSYDGSYITAASATTVYTLNSNGTAYTVAVGTNAGQQNQSQNSIAIGTNAGQINQTANSIVLSGQSTALSGTNAGLFIAPVANAYQSTASSFNVLGYSSQDNQVVQSGVTTTNQQQTIYGEWIQVQLTNAVSITSYALINRSGLPQRSMISWVVVGSADGLNWTLLDSQTGIYVYNASYTLSAATPLFSYFRVIVRQINTASILNLPPSVYICDIGGFILYNNGNSVIGNIASVSSAAPYTLSGTNNNILQLNGITVSIVTWSWPTSVNLQGIYNDNGAIFYNPGIIVSPNGYINNNGTGASGLGFFVSSALVGPAYEYNSSFIAVQGTSTTVNTTSVSITGPTTITGPLTVPTDTVAQGIFLTPSAANSSIILSYFQKIVNTVTKTAGSNPFWANGYSWGLGPTVVGYVGSVLIPNGNIILVPTTVNAVGIYNPSTNTFTTGIAHGQGINNAYYGGVLLPNGNVLFVPQGTVNVGIYNPVNNSFTPYPAASGYSGGGLLPNGLVLFVPQTTSTIGLYNYRTNTFINGPSTGTTGYATGVLMTNGNYVMTPYAGPASTLGIYNPITNTFTNGPSIVGYYGAVNLPNGNVVLVPFSATNVAIYNPTTNTITIGPSTAGGTSYIGGTLLSNGNVLFFPFSSTSFGLYSPVTNTMSSIPAISGFAGGTLLPNGVVIMNPNSALGSIGILSTHLPVPRDICLSPYFNKY
jgi:hypothetical protein